MACMAESAQTFWAVSFAYAMICSSTTCLYCSHGPLITGCNNPVGLTMHNPLSTRSNAQSPHRFCNGNRNRRVALHASYHCCRCHYFCTIYTRVLSTVYITAHTAVVVAGVSDRMGYHALLVPGWCLGLSWNACPNMAMEVASCMWECCILLGCLVRAYFCVLHPV